MGLIVVAILLVLLCGVIVKFIAVANMQDDEMHWDQECPEGDPYE